MAESGSTAIEVTYKPNVYDYRRVLWWYRRKRMIVIIALSILVSLFLVYPILTGSATGVPGIIALFLMSVPLIVALILYSGLMRQANKIADIFEETKVTFNNEGLGSEAGGMAWEEFHRVYETEHDFIFFPAPKVFYCVPKRFFDDQGSVARLSVLLKEKLDTRYIG